MATPASEIGGRQQKQLKSWNVVMRLRPQTKYFKLMNGSSMFFDFLNKQDPKLYVTNNLDCADLSVAANKTIYIMGECNNINYFNSCVSISATQKAFTFYACQHITPEKLSFTKIRDNVGIEEGHFAVQQPYFVGADGTFIESFAGERIQLETKIGSEQAFFCRRNVVYIVSNDVSSVTSPKATLTGRTIMVSIPTAMSLPHSVYAEHKAGIFLICGDQLLIMRNSLEITSMPLDGFKDPNSRIGGISEGKLLINVHSTVVSLQINKSQQIVQKDAGYSSESKSSDKEETPKEQEPDSEKVVNSSELELQILKLQEKVKLQAAEIIRLQSMTLSAMREVSSKFAHNFNVCGILGVGSFGIVYKATNVYDCRTYAVKRISVDLMEMESALKEVRAMARIDHHPGIVRYYNVWTEAPPDGSHRDNTDLEILKRFPLASTDATDKIKNHMANYANKPIFIYMQMQLCDNSLSEWLKEHQSQNDRPLSKMKSWFKQMVAAVDHIHANNLIHRDLKPSNILITKDEVLKLCDLGLAIERRCEGEADTVITRSDGGSHLYMSPEQRCCRPYGSKSDVFPLGLILIELVVAMTSDERNEVFNIYRRELQSARIRNTETAEVVRMLTKADPTLRPSCREMLHNEFLAIIP